MYEQQLERIETIVKKAKRDIWFKPFLLSMFTLACCVAVLFIKTSEQVDLKVPENMNMNVKSDGKLQLTFEQAQFSDLVSAISKGNGSAPIPITIQNRIAYAQHRLPRKWRKWHRHPHKHKHRHY